VGLSRACVENALTKRQLPNLVLGLFRRPTEEQAPENIGSLFLAGDEDTRARPGQAALAAPDGDAERQRGKPRQVPDAFRDELVERDRIAKAASARVRRGGEKAIVRGMATIDVW